MQEIIINLFIIFFKDFDMNYHKFGINLTLISAYKARTLTGPTLIIHENLNKIVPVMPK